MLAILTVAFGAIMAAIPPAAADLGPSDLAGRWSRVLSGAMHPCSDANCRLTYDLVRCGNGWCGVEVKNGKDCGRTALRLNMGAVQPFDVEFTGNYEKVEGTEPYAVMAHLHLNAQQQLPNEQLRLSLLGNTGGSFQAFRRTFPLNIVLMREGDAKCRADPKVS